MPSCRSSSSSCWHCRSRSCCGSYSESSTFGLRPGLTSNGNSMSDQEKDPVVSSSLSKPLVISSILLLLSLAWGLYDEVWGTRPWKGYQARFAKLYASYLKSANPSEAEFEAKVKASADYQKLDKAMQDAENAVK